MPNLWPTPGTQLQRALHSCLLVCCGMGLYAWVALPAFADWYGATGAASPNPAMGQIALIKGVRAVGYGSARLAFWFHALPTMIFLVVVLAGAALKASGYQEAREAVGKRIGFNALFWIPWLVILAGGGHLIALVVTGSWQFPPHSG